MSFRGLRQRLSRYLYSLKEVVNKIRTISPPILREDIKKEESISSKTFLHQVDILLRKALNSHIKELKSKSDSSSISIPDLVAQKQLLFTLLSTSSPISKSHPYHPILLSSLEIRNLPLSQLESEISKNIVDHFIQSLPPT